MKAQKQKHKGKPVLQQTEWETLNESIIVCCCMSTSVVAEASGHVAFGGKVYEFHGWRTYKLKPVPPK